MGTWGQPLAKSGFREEGEGMQIFSFGTRHLKTLSNALWDSRSTKQLKLTIGG